jgi:hypothetical protein
MIHEVKHLRIRRTHARRQRHEPRWEFSVLQQKVCPVTPATPPKTLSSRPERATASAVERASVAFKSEYILNHISAGANGLFRLDGLLPHIVRNIWQLPLVGTNRWDVVHLSNEI